MGCGAGFGDAGWSPHSISILVAPRGKTLCLARGTFLFLSGSFVQPHIPSQPTCLPLSSLRPIHLSLKTESSRDPSHSQEDRDSWAPYSLSSLALQPSPRPGSVVPPAEEAVDPGPSKIPTLLTSSLVLSIPHAPSPAGTGCAALLRQLPWEGHNTSLPASQACRFHPLGLASGRGVLPLSLARVPPTAPPGIRLKAGFPTPTGIRLIFCRCWLAAWGLWCPAFQSMEEADQNADSDLPGPLTPWTPGTNSSIDSDINLRNSWEDSFEGLSGD